MDPHSLTYSQLPDNLLEAVLMGALTLPEAAELWDNWLLTPDNSVRPLPPHLWPAVQRLNLLGLEVDSPDQ